MYEASEIYMREKESVDVCLYIDVKDICREMR